MPSQRPAIEVTPFEAVVSPHCFAAFTFWFLEKLHADIAVCT